MLPSRRHLLIAITLEILCLLSFATAQISNSDSGPLPSGPFRIAGIAVNALGGAPLARARVTLYATRNPNNLQWGVTGDDGRFEFRNLAAGKYALRGAKIGFIASDYDRHELFSTAIVTGAGIDTEHLILRLTPHALISGKVLDEAGEPVRNAEVVLYREDHSGGIGRIHNIDIKRTDDQGTYEFASLDAGTYFIAAKATPWYAVHSRANGEQASGSSPTQVDSSLDVAYPVTYYKDVTDPDEAAAIPLRGGERLEVDLHLSPVQSLRLIFHAPDHYYTMPNLQQRSFDGMEYIEGGQVEQLSSGVFEISGIPAGRYTVQMQKSSPGGEVVRSETEMDLSADGQDLEATRGEATGEIKASVKVLGEEKLPPRLGIILRNSKSRAGRWEEVSDKGEVEFSGITPGRYEILARAQGRAYAVVRIMTPNGESAGHTLEVPSGVSLTVSLTVVAGAANVEGFVKRHGQPAAGAMVVLVPENPDANRDFFRRDQSDLDGSFSLPDVIPGKYTACAIQDGWDLDWGKPAIIAHYCEHGQKVEVSNTSKSVVQLDAPVEVQSK